MTSGFSDVSRPVDDSWIVAIHRSHDDPAPIGSGLLIDEHRVLTCAHVVRSYAGGQARDLWVAFPKSNVLMSRRIAVRRIVIAQADGQPQSDVAILELSEDIGAQPAARLRCPEPRELAGRDWWSFGFPEGDPLGIPAFGRIGEAHGYGWVGLAAHSGQSQRVSEGYSGAALWSSAYGAVVGIIGQANSAGDARALTIAQADRALPEAKLRQLADWSVEAVEESALASWGWSLSDDPEAGRHWKPRARGVARDSERGFRFRGRQAALTELVGWITSVSPQRRALVVTGSPGVGKSAVLGRVVTSADTRIAAILPPHDDAVRSPVGSVACAVHAKSKTALDVAVEIARAASAPLPQQTGDLAIGLGETLAARPGRLFAVVIDALDEAATPRDARDIVRWIVRPLVEDLADRGVRIVVGARRRDHQGDLFAVFGAAISEIDLDDPAYFEPLDLMAYALASLQLLGAERHGNPYAEPGVAGPVAARIGQLAEGNFLVAGLIARAHGLHDVSPVRPEEISFSPKVDDALNEFLERIPRVGQCTAHELLTALAYAEAPGFTIGLWHAAVHALYGGAPSEESIDGFARASAANFLVEDSAGPGGGAAERAYRLFHQALNDVLLSGRGTTVEDERSLARAFLNVGRRGRWRAVPAYLLRSLPRHAERGNVMPELMAEDAYPLYADLRRLIRTALRSAEVKSANPEVLRLLRKSQRAIDAPPDGRAALFSVVEAQEQLGRRYRDAPMPTAYRAVWAQTEREEEQAVLEGHSGRVNHVTAIAVGRRQLLASAGSDGTIRLWDPDTGENVRVIGGGHPINTVCPVSAPAGRALLASGGRDGTVRLWDPETGALVRAMDGHAGPVTALCTVAGDSGRLFVASLVGSRTVQLWDPEIERSVSELPKPMNNLLSLCAIDQGDERDVLALGRRDGSVHLWYPFTGEVRNLARGFAGAAIDICALQTPTRTRVLAVASNDKTVRLYDIATGALVRALDQPANPVSALCPVRSAEGRTHLAVTSGQGVVQVWPVDGVTSDHTMSANTGRVQGVCPVRTTDGTILLASAGEDGTVRLWSPWERIDPVRGRRWYGRQVALRSWKNRSGESMLCTMNTEGEVRQWDPDTGDLVRTWRTRFWHASAVCLIAQDHEGPLLATAGPNGALTMSYAAGGTRWNQERARSGRHMSAVNDMTVLKGGSRDLTLITASKDGTLRRWNVRDGELLRRPTMVGKQLHAVCTVRMSGASAEILVAAGAADRLVRVWRLEDDELLWTLEGHGSRVTAVFPVPTDPGPPLLGSVSTDAELRLWKLDSGQPQCQVRRTGRWLTAACAITGKHGTTLIATGGADRIARLWDLHGRAVMEIPARHEIATLAACGNRLFLGLTDGVMAVDIDESAAAGQI
jgi:WD40 repeat protein